MPAPQVGRNHGLASLRETGLLDGTGSSMLARGGTRAEREGREGKGSEEESGRVEEGRVPP